MTTSDSSTVLRAAVDAVVDDRHEKAFQILDLYQAVSRQAERCARSRARSRELAAVLDELIDDIDRPRDPRDLRDEDA